jgi:hypothetical protein
LPPDFNTKTHGDNQGKMMDNFKDYMDKFKDTKKADNGADTNEKADFATVDGSGGDTDSEDSNF